MNQLFILIVLNFLILIFNNVLLLYLTSHFKQLNMQAVKQNWWLFFLITLLISIAGSCFTYFDFLNLYIRSTAFSYGLILISQIVLTYILLKKYFTDMTFSTSIFVQSLNAVITWIFDYIIITIAIDYIKELDTFGNYIATVLLSLVTSILALGLVKISSKTRIFNAIKELVSDQRFILIFGIMLFIFDVILYHWTTSDSGISLLGSLILAIVYFVFLIVFSLWSFATEKDKKLELAESIVIQQQQYVGSLEHIQLELRSLQHDYKNMLSGIYLHASKGNNQEIQDFLGNKFFTFNMQIEEEIKQQNQLLQIKTIEVKSLILTKMTQARSMGINIQLEAIEAVEKIAMEQSDFLRVLGIFLDNAIEAASQECNPQIKIIFIQEIDKLIMLVKNTTTKDIEMKKISEKSYSTKGKNRGLGLATVQSILNTYPNILHETHLKNSEFTQIITIK